jgi:hypothetical protein
MYASQTIPTNHKRFTSFRNHTEVLIAPVEFQLVVEFENENPQLFEEQPFPEGRIKRMMLQMETFHKLQQKYSNDFTIRK